MGNSGSKTRDVFTKTVARVQIAAPSRVHRAAIMLCGETLCGDKFLFSFPVSAKCQCGLTIECENRLFALTLVYCNTGRKRKYSLELDADWFVDMVVQLSIMRGQKKAARPYRDPKYFTEFLELFYEIPKLFAKNEKIS